MMLRTLSWMSFSLSAVVRIFESGVVVVKGIDQSNKRLRREMRSEVEVYS